MNEVGFLKLLQDVKKGFLYIQVKYTSPWVSKDRQAVSVFVPNNVAHDFKNVGDGNMIILAYTDKLYDPADTIQYKL